MPLAGAHHVTADNLPALLRRLWAHLPAKVLFVLLPGHKRRERGAIFGGAAAGGGPCSRSITRSYRGSPEIGAAPTAGAYARR